MPIKKTKEADKPRGRLRIVKKTPEPPEPQVISRNKTVKGDGDEKKATKKISRGIGDKPKGQSKKVKKIPEPPELRVLLPEENLSTNEETPKAENTVPVNSQSDTQETLVDNEDRHKAGWVSHAYSQSRKVDLNAKFCMDNRCVALSSESLEMDYYRVLRTRILHKTGADNGNTIMITSALPGEGKTLTSVNLALTLAKDYNKTALLVDCDLRRQNVHKLLGIRSEKGLTDYLLKDTSIAELILWPGIDKLTIISGGRPFSESAELLGSPKMKELVSDMKTRYPERYVLFDAPPILTGADALAFTPLVDHILVVVQANKTSIRDIQKALDLLPKEKILGIVLNRVKNPAAPPYLPYGR
ncbi:MAG: tyrosine protein kinase [Syntrophus sp. (in: bacteria)]|nr:tyrosine protein kinase [Syntrophus sp. (in: bacteria)]